MLSDLENKVISAPFFDINAWNLKYHSDLVNFAALDQMIINILFTIPGERLFNLGFGGPLYQMLFKNDNSDIILDAMSTIIRILEMNLPDIIIDRQNSSFITNGPEHTGTLTLFYYSKTLKTYHQLSKYISN